ncbi:MAG TPA: SGNH/GDSL hydrolase family protein [Thermoleophilaceae bacterium]|jgi:hypothetical protein
MSARSKRSPVGTPRRLVAKAAIAAALVVAMGASAAEVTRAETGFVTLSESGSYTASTTVSFRRTIKAAIDGAAADTIWGVSGGGPVPASAIPATIEWDWTVTEVRTSSYNGKSCKETTEKVAVHKAAGSVMITTELFRLGLGLRWTSGGNWKVTVSGCAPTTTRTEPLFPCGAFSTGPCPQGEVLCGFDFKVYPLAADPCTPDKLASRTSSRRFAGTKTADGAAFVLKWDVPNPDYREPVPTPQPPPPAPVTRVASFGDSYTSGEGVPGGYDCGTDLHSGRYFAHTTMPFQLLSRKGDIRSVWSTHCDTRTGSTALPADLRNRPSAVYENLCHRHRRAYPVQIREKLGLPAEEGIFVACSNAYTENVGLTRRVAAQHPQSPPGVHGAETQIVAVRPFAGSRPPDLVTIGVGGNDAGFAYIIQECVARDCVADAEFTERIVNGIGGRTFELLRTTFGGLRREFPAAAVAAFGYPDVIGNTGGCDSSFGALGYVIDERERIWIADVVVPAINAAVRRAATEAGVTYVDLTQLTAGHGICSDEPWINPWKFGDDIGMVGNESFHPNEKFHDAVAQFFIASYTDGAGRLTFRNPAPTLTERPKLGAPVTVGSLAASGGSYCGNDCVQPTACVLSCEVLLAGRGFAAGSDLDVTMRSDPVDLGTVEADGAGRINETLSLPRGVEPGVHTISLAGTAPSGERQYGTAFLRVYKKAPRVKVARAGKQRLVALLKKGLSVYLTCPQRCVADAAVALGAKAAKKLKLKGPLGHGRVELPGAARQKVTIKISAAAKRRLKRQSKVEFVVTAVLQNGDPRAVTVQKIAIRR